jgi:hypothetical protein
MGISNKLEIKSFAPKKKLIGWLEASACILPLLILYVCYFRIYLHKNTAGNRRDALIGFVVLLVIAVIIFTFALRIRLVSIRNSDELIVVNLWNTHRISWANVTSLGVGKYSLIRGLGPKWPVVMITYVGESASDKEVVPVVASYSLGKVTDLLDEFASIADAHKIPCDISKMIY